MAPARSGCLDKLVNRGRPRGVDNLKEENKHHSLEKRGGVRKGCQVFGLVEQVGMGLWKQVDPHNLIVVPALGSGKDEAKEVFTVDEPASLKNIEHVEDTWVDKRCNPALFHRPYATRRRHTSRLGRGRACSTNVLTR